MDVQQLIKIGALAVGFQIIPGSISWGFGTEKFYDLTGSTTYVLLALSSQSANGPFTAASFTPTGLRDSGLRLLCNAAQGKPQGLLAAMTVVWAGRLGTHLFYRILSFGEDRRFRRAKASLPLWSFFWGMQGVWVCLTALPLWMATSLSSEAAPLLRTPYKSLPRPAMLSLRAGFALWVLGMAVEIVADWQKYRFRANKANDSKFISHGLWALSRHPNYLGEILLWSGAWMVAAGAVPRSYALLALASPVFVYGLLSHVSGIPILERSADRRFGSQPAYQEYKRRTPVLFPNVFSWFSK